MKQLHEVLIEKRLTKNYTQVDVAERSGLTRSQVRKFEKGESLPNFDTLIRLADFYKCSLDELTGRDFNGKKSKAFKGMDFADILRAKREAKGWTLEVLAEKYYGERAQLRLWEGGYLRPGFIFLLCLADLFECSLDELVGR